MAFREPWVRHEYDLLSPWPVYDKLALLHQILVNLDPALVQKGGEREDVHGECTVKTTTCINLLFVTDCLNAKCILAFNHNATAEH